MVEPVNGDARFSVAVARFAARGLRASRDAGEVLRNTGWLAAANGLGVLLTFPQGVLVARGLGARQYGLLVIVMSFVVVADLLTSSRMNEFVVKHVSQALSRQDRSVAAASLKVAMFGEIASSFVAFGIVILAAPLGATLLLQGSEPHLIHMYAPFILCNLIAESSLGLFQAVGRFRLQAQVELISQVAKFAGVVIVFVANGSIGDYLIAYVVAQVVTSAFSAFWVFRAASEELGPAWWRCSMSSLEGQGRSMFSFAINTNFSATLSLVGRTADPLLLGYFRAPVEAGYYKLAVSLVNFAMIPVGPLTDVLYPLIARLVAAGRWEEVRQTWKRGTAFSFVWILPAAALLLVSAPIAIPLVYGDEFRPVMSAVLVLVPGSCFAYAYFWARPALLSLGLAWYATKLNAVMVVMKLALSLAIVPVAGYVGSAGLVSLTSFVGVALGVRRAKIELAREVASEQRRSTGREL